MPPREASENSPRYALAPKRATSESRRRVPETPKWMRRKKTAAAIRDNMTHLALSEVPTQLQRAARVNQPNHCRPGPTHAADHQLTTFGEVARRLRPALFAR